MLKEQFTQKFKLAWNINVFCHTESKQLTQIYTTPVNQLFMMEQLYNGFVYYNTRR